MKKYFWITISTLCIISWWFLIELADPSGTLLGRALVRGRRRKIRDQTLATTPH
jgi:hypothetical protein